MVSAPCHTNEIIRVNALMGSAQGPGLCLHFVFGEGVGSAVKLYINSDGLNGISSVTETDVIPSEPQLSFSPGAVGLRS